jgi:RHS repeat-associated protein
LDAQGEPELNADGLPVEDPARLNYYQYNGKELNQDLGLNWLDYGARWYDPAIGRFPNVDPIIEKFPNLTPYNYASNNPVTNIDLWGLQGWPANKLKGEFVAYFNKLFGTNIKAEGRTKTRPRKYISVKAEGNGKVVAGFGLGLKGNAFGIQGEVEADIGSVKLVEVNANTEDGFDGHLIGSEGEVRSERGGAAMVEIGGGQVRIGGEIEAERSTKNGETTSATQTTKLGLEVQGKVYGYENSSEVEIGSDGKPQSVTPDTNQTSFSLGLGFQVIIGAEGKFKITFSFSSKKPESNE